MKPYTPASDAKTLPDLLKKVCCFGYQPSRLELSLIQDLLWELTRYREGGVTEEILRRNDGGIKVGRGCIIAVRGLLE